MADPFLAEIIMFGSNFPPRGWAQTNGQLLPISSNSALFSLIGTIYGGDGRTTLALPDMRGRSPMHYGGGIGLSHVPIGARGGSQQFSLTRAELPEHTHTMRAERGPSNSNNPESNMFAVMTSNGATNAAGEVVNPTGYKPYNPANGEVTLASQTIGNTGAGQSVIKQSPFIAVNFIIALQGLYPSRS